jgi:hypothetical protein
MANSQKGQVSVTAGRDVYTVAFSINAMCELENELEMSIVEAAALMGDPNKVTISLLRSMFLAALHDSHPELTELDAGRIMQDAGIGAVGDAINRAVTLAFPETAAPERGRPLAKARAA